MSVITVERQILEKNDAIALQLQSEFQRRNIFSVNILSSPGSGKTSLIESLCRTLDKSIKVSVIIGDLQTDNDAKRIGALGIPVVQIITNGACHLDALLVRDAFNKLEEPADLLMIENVGNLVCPAGFHLGEALKIVVISSTEGDDKPLKYPVAFRNSSVMILNKTDLLPYINCIPSDMIRNARSINPSIEIFQTSCITGEGIIELCRWFKDKVIK
jgi:hydrogenase nickel incorporation protein HypB